MQSENTSEPLQLIEFLPNETTGKTEIKLIHENLDRILKPCGDRPLSILTVCGPSRMGKSFLLGYIIRRLEAMETGEADWMGWNRETEPLRGFKFLNGSNPETQGIWVWSRPFIIKTEDGKEICLLLVDTQGTQDEFTTTKIMSTIVGLSLLMSSVLVFNFFTNLQEDLLTALATYVQFGLLAIERSDDERKPFQKLIFLIRDWNNPGEHKYGESGGKKFLEKKLSVIGKNNQSPEAKDLRINIQKCFQDIGCFLMPHIGDNALELNFRGSVSELSTKFAQKLEEFINGLIDTNDIVLKEIMGDEVNTREFKSYLETLVETFNSDEIPTHMNVLEANAKYHCTITSEKAQKKYEDILSKAIREANYLSDSALQTAHKDAEKAAGVVFMKAKTLGDSTTLLEFKEKLHTNITNCLKRMEEENESRREKFISLAKDHAISAYKNLLEQKFPLTGESENAFYEEEDIRKLEKDARSQAFREFRDILSIETGNSLLDLQTDLNPVLNEIYGNMVDKNKSHAFSAHNYMEKLVKHLLNEYKKRLGDFLNANKFADAGRHQDFHQDNMRITLTSFHKAEKRGSNHFHISFLKDLEKLMEEVFENQMKTIMLELTEIKQQTETIFAKECVKYLDSLKAAIIEDENCVDPLVFTKIHEKRKEKFWETISPIFSKFPEDSKQYKDLVQKFEEEMDKSSKKVQSEFNCILEKSHESIENASKESYKHYQESMEKFFDNLGATCLDDDEIEDAHRRIKNEILEEFRSFPKTGPYAKNQEMLNLEMDELSKKMNRYFKTVKADNVAKRETAKKDAELLVRKCLDQYVDHLKDEVNKSVEVEQDLKDTHSRVKEKVMKLFQQQCPLKASKDIKGYLEKLELDIEDAYEGQVELLKMKKKSEKVKTKELLVDCRQQYLAEMEKQCNSEFFIKPADLKTLHEKTIQIVLRKLKTMFEGDMTKEQMKNLIEDMEIQFEGFKIRNDMKLNFSKGVTPAIGIDLGTTYCCVAVYWNGKVIIIPNLAQGGNLTTPSYVAYSSNGKDVVIGELAKEYSYKNLENTIYDAKRIIGRKIKDPVLQEDMKKWPFTVKEDEGVPKILANGQLLYPEQVSSKLLAYFKEMAEKFLPSEVGPIKKAVITVPAYFNDGQRQATVDAGKLAGLEVLTILNEPTAAAVAYFVERLEKVAKKVLVYDLGGGTFDVAIVDIKANEIEVLGVNGDTHLGGEDFDMNMVTYCAQEFKEKTGFDFMKGIDSSDRVIRNTAKMRMRRVQLQCEKAKKQLATARSSDVSVEVFVNNRDLNVEFTLEKFNELNDKEFRRTIEIVEKALKEVNVRKEEIDDIVLVGGSSRALKVQEMVKKFFAGKALNHSIHPDHCVAYGAAVQAAIMNGEQTKEKLGFSKIQDVSPLSIGIEVSDESMSVVVPKNTKIPCRLKGDYVTSKPDQTFVSIIIFQGERKVAKENEKLGEFTLTGIPPAPKGEEKLEVWMEINSMGILHVEAVSVSTGGKESITITENKSRMSEEIITKLLRESA